MGVCQNFSWLARRSGAESVIDIGVQLLDMCSYQFLNVETFRKSAHPDRKSAHRDRAMIHSMAQYNKLIQFPHGTISSTHKYGSGLDQDN